MRLQRFVKFIVVGTLAFAVDGGGLFILHEQIGLDPYTARLFSFAVALVSGWLISRTWVFGTRTFPRFGEFMRYAAVQGLGASVNLIIYAGILQLAPVPIEPLIALLIAALCAAIVNFIGASHFVFKRKP